MPASTSQAQWHAPPQQPFQPNWTPTAPNAADKTARHALGWSIAGMLICCFPLSLVGLVLGFRARSLATEQKAAIPAASTIAIALSLLAMSGALIFGVWFAFEEAAVSERVDELTARVAATDSSEQLLQQTACELAELRIRTDGWKDDTPIVIDGFDCPGQVLQKESEAELPDFSFNTSSNSRVTVTVCYKRGVRWTVKAFREDGGGCLDQPSTDPTRPE